MNDLYVSALGIFAVFLTTVQFIPQVRKAYGQKDLGGLSASTFFLITVTASTWIIYGIIKQDLVVIIANALVLISAVAILVRISQIHDKR